MPAVDLIHANRAQIHARLADGASVVACLCAAWCDVCTEFRPGFDRLADGHPDKLVLWIDIEDEADVVGDFDVENFPTLLIEQDAAIAFFGPVEADIGAIGRLVQARTERSMPAAGASPLPSLRSRLAAVLGN